jgi:uncharacterized protein YndB with AHSA1/START domain
MDKNNPVVVNESFSISRKKLWDIITQPHHMTKWFFENIPNFMAEVGFETAFDVKSDTRVFPHQWKITEVIPHQKIVYDWHYEGYDGRSIVSFELEDDGLNTQLVVTHINTQPYDESIPEFKQESCNQGWNYFIKDRLKSYIESLNDDKQ